MPLFDNSNNMVSLGQAHRFDRRGCPAGDCKLWIQLRLSAAGARGEWCIGRVLRTDIRLIADHQNAVPVRWDLDRVTMAGGTRLHGVSY